MKKTRLLFLSLSPHALVGGTRCFILKEVRVREKDAVCTLLQTNAMAEQIRRKVLAHTRSIIPDRKRPDFVPFTLNLQKGIRIMKRSWVATTLALVGLTLAVQSPLVYGDEDDREANKNPCASDGHEEGTVRFPLFPANQKILQCIADPNSSALPTAEAVVRPGNLNDRMTVCLRNAKPGLAFDIFTVEHSRLVNNGAPDPNFTGFGFSWYQSDLEVNKKGNASASIRTILVDQIFGFVDSTDPTKKLAPVNTFHVGFWFNRPEDAFACGFPTNAFTPFNGDHHAGPLAMISVPDAKTHLGPLCTHPDPNSPSGCNP